MGAETDTGIAETALINIVDYTAILKGECLCRAGRNAFSAGRTQGNGFRIVAVNAVLIAALKEYGGPVSVTVHTAEGNNFVNRCGKLSCHCGILTYPFGREMSALNGDLVEGNLVGGEHLGFTLMAGEHNDLPLCRGGQPFQRGAKPLIVI